MTGLGKSVTILWMFFGILCFGVFSGQVLSEVLVLNRPHQWLAFE